MNSTKINKGQGALEYLLLIGGAVVVAAVVVVLILNLGSTNQAQSEAATMGAICTSLAATADSTPDCADTSSVSGNQPKIRNNKTSTCWQCGGTYPNCTAGKTSGTFNTAGNCLSSETDYAILS